MHFQFSTLAFIFILFVIFNICPKKLRSYVLLAASILFIYWQGHGFGLLVLLAMTAFTWLTGLLISDADKNKALKIIGGMGVAALALVLFGWKYFPFLGELLHSEKLSGIFKFAAPIGLSFYTFQAISYLADITMGKRKAQKNPFKFALYMTWFPKWISGPIEREQPFSEQIDNCEKAKFFDKERALKSLTYLTWGLFMKMVLADRIGGVVDIVFEDPTQYGSVTLILTSILYTMQIYCDFAGYTNIMMGISVMFGIDITQNFKTPYLTENIVEFWRCWHISLSNFLKDYVYITLGGNRKGAVRKIFNVMMVFFVSGIWHGVGVTFIIWGLLHGVFNVLAGYLRKSSAAFLVKGMSGRIVNFLLVSFAWIFFRASSMENATAFVKGMIPFANPAALTEGLKFKEELLLGMGSFEWWLLAICMMALIVMDVIAYRKDTIPPEVIRLDFGLIKRAVFFTVFIIVILIFGKYGSGEEIRSFVYMQF